MELVSLFKGKYKLLSPHHNGSIPVLDGLAALPGNMRKNAEGITALMERYAVSGEDLLTPDQFHKAGGNIYRFRKGRLRLYCFIDEGNLIVLSHSAIKKEQKTAKVELAKAEALRTRYLDAKNAGELIFMEVGDV